MITATDSSSDTTDDSDASGTYSFSYQKRANPNGSSSHVLILGRKKGSGYKQQMAICVNKK